MAINSHNTYQEPEVASYEDMMSWAQDAGQVEKWLGGKNRFAKKGMGFGLADWDVDAGKFNVGSRRLDRMHHSFGRNTARGRGFSALDDAQMTAIADTVESSLSKLYSSRDAEKKSEMLLGKIQAKSDMMEQLIETRRVKREAEIAQTRGLY